MSRPRRHAARLADVDHPGTPGAGRADGLLATVASTKVNGVAELHSQLLRDKVLHDFSEYWPEKFTNVTNGVTPRRFMRLANPALPN